MKKLLRKLPISSRAALRGFGEGAYAIVSWLVLHFPSFRVRTFLLAKVLRMSIADGTRIYMLSEVREAHRITVGRNSIIGTGCALDGRRGITIGSNVNFSSEAAIWTLQHDPQSPTFGIAGGPVRIGDRAWVSTRAIILPNVTIGEGAVIAAGAVVTQDVAPWTIVGGVPAKYIGQRSPATYQFDAPARNSPWFI